MKKSIQMLTMGALALAALVLSGCISRPGAIQDKTKPLSQDGYTVVAPEVSATETMVSVFGVSVGDLRGSPSRRMYQKCLSQAPGADALIEYSTDTKMVFLGPVNVTWFTMTGTPVKTK